MKENKFKRTERTLYNYKNLDVKIKNIEIDIENIENDITVKAIGYEEKTGQTNKFSSSVEDEVVRREEHVKEIIETLNAKKKYNLDLKGKIERALGQLSRNEYELVELRYLNKEKFTWAQIGMKLGFDKDYCIKLKNRIINKLSDLIYP